MIVTPQEYCDTINRAKEKYGQAGVFLAMEIMETLEKMEKQGIITAKQEKGRTYYRLND